MTTKPYRALKPFVHQNFRCDAGAEIALTAEQAEFLVHGGFVEPVQADQAAALAESSAAPVEAAEPAEPDTEAEPKRRKGGRA